MGTLIENDSPVSYVMQAINAPLIIPGKNPGRTGMSQRNPNYPYTAAEPARSSNET